jgi:hypothetical protein
MFWFTLIPLIHELLRESSGIEGCEDLFPVTRRGRENQVATARIPAYENLIGGKAKLSWDSDVLTSATHEHSGFGEFLHRSAPAIQQGYLAGFRQV